MNKTFRDFLAWMMAQSFLVERINDGKKKKDKYL